MDRQDEADQDAVEYANSIKDRVDFIDSVVEGVEDLIEAGLELVTDFRDSQLEREEISRKLTRVNDERLKDRSRLEGLEQQVRELLAAAKKDEGGDKS